ncbi:MAG: hypothetical protein AB1942_11460 [Pseudomonadota bacterium]
MQRAWSGEVGWRFALTVVAALAAYILVMVALAARSRGIWLDEIWSLWLSQGDVPLEQVATQRWFQDVHPPVFSAINWLLDPVVGEGMFGRRMINLIWVLYFFAGAGFLAAKYPATRKFILVFAVLILANRHMALYFPEHRSYTMVLGLSATVICCLQWLFSADRDFDLRKDLGAALLTVFSVVLALNVHFVTTLILGLMLGLALLALVLEKRYRAAGLVFVAGALAGPPLLGALYAQSLYLTDATQTFWVETGPLGAARKMVNVGAITVVANLVALAVALIVAAPLVLKGGLGDRLRTMRAAEPSQRAWRFVAVMVAAVIVPSLLLMAISLVRPIVVERYLLSFVAIIMAGIAALAAEQILARKWLFVLFALNAVLAFTVFVQKPLHDPRWNETAVKVKRIVDTCPGTRVYALYPTYVKPYPAAANQPPVHWWGYQHVAEEAGFRVINLDPEKSGPIALSASCPTVLWAEHMEQRKHAAEVLDDEPFAAGAPQLQAALRAAKVDFGAPKATGFVLVIPPTPAAQPAAPAPAAP